MIENSPNKFSNGLNFLSNWFLVSDETSIEEIFDKISNQLDEVDITATTSTIKTTTKTTVSFNQGKRNIFHQLILQFFKENFVLKKEG